MINFCSFFFTFFPLFQLFFFQQMCMCNLIGKLSLEELQFHATHLSISLYVYISCKRLGILSLHSVGSSRCPRGPFPCQGQDRPYGMLWGKCHTRLSHHPAGRLHSSPGGQFHSHRHPLPLST